MAFSQWMSKTSGKATLKPATLQRNRSGKNRVLANKKMLRQFWFPIIIYHILNCVDTAWGFFWLNYILTQIPQINFINND